MSYNIGLSGLRTTNQSLDVISQNIANVSTAGFKAGRAELAAVYSGGQPGGVEMGNVSQNFSKDGGKEFSGRDLDMAISGQGFFILKDQNGLERFTRAGMFSLTNIPDGNGNERFFVTSPNGMKLQGYGVDKNGNLQASEPGDLQIQATTSPAKASTSLEFVANFKGDATIPGVPFDHTDSNTYNFSYTSELYDSQGNSHTLTQYLAKTGANTWEAFYSFDGSTPSVDPTATLPSLGGSVISFNPDGSLDTPSGMSFSFSPPGVEIMDIELSMVGSTQYAGDFSVSQNSTDGYASGDYTGLSVDEDGSISALYTNGEKQLLGQVALASFNNPSGLAQSDSTTWQATFASGTMAHGAAGTGPRGTLTPGAYEGSNVDLTGELVNLMTAQRNYQANAKSVSTADQLTQVLFSNM